MHKSRWAITAALLLIVGLAAPALSFAVPNGKTTTLYQID
jgi:hypothetical protein